jgi:acyl-CoA reductase-like NAD-dependent aldehyde dehydrogenase
MEYQLFIDGQWTGGGEPLEVRNKYTQEVICQLPTAREAEVERAIAAARRAAPEMAALLAYRRSEILKRAAELIQSAKSDLAKTIAARPGRR